MGLHPVQRPEFTFGNMGLIVNRTSNAVTGLTPAISVRPLNRKGAGMQFPCPQREIAFTQAHEAGRGPFPGQIARYIDHQSTGRSGVTSRMRAIILPDALPGRRR